MAKVIPNPVIDGLLTHAVDNCTDAVLLCDAKGSIQYANRAAETRFGFAGAELLKLSLYDLNPDLAPKEWAQNWEHIREQGPLNLNVGHTTSSGEAFAVEVGITHLVFEDQESALLIVRELHDRQAAEQRMQLMQFSFDRIADTACWIDSNGTIINANESACRTTGYSLNELLGMPIWNLDNYLSSEEWLERWAHFKAKYSVTFNTEMIAKDGALLPVEVSASYVKTEDQEFVCAFARDIRERQYQERAMRRLATHDLLTELPNRVLLEDRFQQSVTRARRDKSLFAVVTIDLDKFRLINDNYGMRIGDALLVGISLRLRPLVRACDTLSRPGGDEFMILLEQLSGPEDGERAVNAILGAFTEPFVVDGQTLHVTASIGLALFPRDGENLESLVKNAEMAMYSVKESGGNQFQYYLAEMGSTLSEQLTLHHDLHTALEQNQFEIYYQPVIGIGEEQHIGAEALLRWHHPSAGMVPPIKFIPLAEESGLIVQIGAWVLDEVCRQIRAWLDQGLTAMPVAVNLSALQLRQEEIVETVVNALDKHKLEPRMLTLELTESMIMQNPEQVIGILNRLRKKGLTLAVDDFGTGYSSLAYLKRFPIDIIKIDRSFIRDLATDGDDAIITTTIIGMSHSLGYRVTAEGIEDVDQLDYLRTYRCDHAQGYLFSRPVPAGQYEALLRKGLPKVSELEN